MILRHICVRHGRIYSRALLSPPQNRQWQRSLTTRKESSGSDMEASSSITPHATREVNAALDETNLASSKTEAPVTDQVRLDYQAMQQMRQTTGRLGTEIADVYRPHTLLSNPPNPSEITLELLLASQAHLGHSTSLWHPANSQYIFGIRQGIHIISLEQTAAYLRRACKVVEGITYRGGLVLFVGNRPGHSRIVIDAAKRAGGCHLFQWWIPGTITNRQQILGSCRTKIVDEFDQQVSTQENQAKDQPALKPDLVVCLNPQENFVMLRECGEHGIPTIGVIDTDTNPTWVTYPIPANDDSLRCMQVIGGVLGKAGEQGKAKRIDAAKQGNVPYHTNVEMGNQIASSQG